MSVYEVHVGSWRQGLSYRELADELVDYVVAAGFTHVEFMPVAEHPFGGSWGYQVTSYYAPTSRFGTPDDFRYLVDRAHQAGIGVIVDWVPAHFPKDEWALARFDGTPLYEHADPRRGEQLDWGTLRLRLRPLRGPQLPRRQRAVLVQGVPHRRPPRRRRRLDALPGLLPRGLGAQHPRRPGEPRGGGVPAGDERDRLPRGARASSPSPRSRPPGRASPGRRTSAAWASASSGTWAGCTTRWATCEREPVHRSYHHGQLTFSMMYAYSENYVLPISHDEVVYGKGSLLRKMPGDRWQQLANLRAYLAYMWAHPGKQLLFMGSEFGQDAEWAESRSLDWWHLDDPAHRGDPAAGDRPQRPLQGARRALVAGRRPGGLPVDRRQRRLGQRAVVPAVRQAGRQAPGRRRRSGDRGRARLGAGLRGELLRLAAPRVPDRPARGRATGARCSTPTPTATAAPGSATSAASRRSRSRGTASRSRRRWPLPRWARSGSCTRAEPATGTPDRSARRRLPTGVDRAFCAGSRSRAGTTAGLPETRGRAPMRQVLRRALPTALAGVLLAGCSAEVVVGQASPGPGRAGGRRRRRVPDHRRQRHGDRPVRPQRARPT